MIDIVKQIVKYYLENKKKPTEKDLIITDMSLLEKRGCLFVTLYKAGEIVGSAGNILEISKNILNEIIENTIEALCDNRFKNLELADFDKINYRLDLIKTKNLLTNNKKINDINPINSGVIAIKKDGEKLAVILPNIATTLTSGKDLEIILGKKLNEKFNEDDYIIYEITTEIITDF